MGRTETAHARGVTAEDRACAALRADGWTIRARRLRTEAGEIDIIAEQDGLLAIVEVKARPRLATAAEALTPKQRDRLLAATDLVLERNPDWGANGVRFDVIVVDAAGVVRRIADAFRREV